MSERRDARSAPATGSGGRWSDHQMDQLIGRLLQAGVLFSAATVIAGGAMLLARYGGDPADFRTFGGVVAPLRSIDGIVRAALALDSRAIVQLGLVMLIATPVARVAFSLVSFLFRRDWLYVALTGVVLALLLYSLVWGAG